VPDDLDHAAGDDHARAATSIRSERRRSELDQPLAASLA
jgi:hypothetical protein